MPSPVKAALKRWANPWVLAALAGMVLVTFASRLFRHVPDPPPVERTVADWTLEDAEGRPVGSETLRGSVHLVAIADLECAAGCEAATAALQQMGERLRALGAPVRFVTLLAAPTTPQQRADWAGARGADPRQWVVAGSTDGSACSVAFALRGRTTSGDPCTSARALAGGGALLLVDRSGGIRGTYTVEGLGLDETFHRTLHVLDEK